MLTVLLFVLPALETAIGVWSIRNAPNVALGVWWTVFGTYLLFILFGRPICQHVRTLVHHWTERKIASPYRPTAPLRKMSTGYWWNGYSYDRWKAYSIMQRWLRSRTRDPAAWRDYAWLAFVPLAIGPVVALPPVSVAVAVSVATAEHLPWLAALPFLLGVASAPYAWRVVGPAAAAVLAKSEAARLSERIRDLVATQADMTVTQAAEIRRIERDLHDGAQARLVALGMTLASVERALRSDPNRAARLLAEARRSTTAAVAELRELVRGITPPVLIERGLVEAIRALALNIPLTVRVRSTIKGRLELPAESALYFGVTELLTNAVKHAHASAVTIIAEQTADAVRITVSDDGSGGAAVSRQGGLRGLEQRLAPFGGTLAISSPPGGPTTATMVVPCEYS
ncbi:histidine kinase [Micromonospora sp. NPDC049559]|uniref:sensor histidine kinase n=1 Tax=Micromonospora sp. NPDC049559 TaxID=3155923 RepID=UPI0034237B82